MPASFLGAGIPFNLTCGSSNTSCVDKRFLSALLLYSVKWQNKTTISWKKLWILIQFRRFDISRKAYRDIFLQFDLHLDLRHNLLLADICRALGYDTHRQTDRERTAPSGANRRMVRPQSLLRTDQRVSYLQAPQSGHRTAVANLTPAATRLFQILLGRISVSVRGWGSGGGCSAQCRIVLYESV